MLQESIEVNYKVIVSFRNAMFDYVIYRKYVYKSGCAAESGCAAAKICVDSSFADKEVPAWFYRPERCQATPDSIQCENLNLLHGRGPPCSTCAGDLPHLGQAAP